MWWHLHNLTETIKNRKTLSKCERCRMLYKKNLTECPSCAGVSDIKLRSILRKRSDERIGIGKIMLYGMVVIVVIMLLFS